jgi:hypothetical protein
MATTGARKEIDELIHSEVRTNRMPRVEQFTTASRPIPTTGLLTNPHTSASPIPMPEIRPIFASSSLSAGAAQKRHNDSVNDDSEGPAKKRKRGPRTCQKCGRKGVEEAKLAREEGCRGNTGSAKCVFACRDCGIKVCSGRSSRKPNKPCNNVNK